MSAEFSGSCRLCFPLYLFEGWVRRWFKHIKKYEQWLCSFIMVCIGVLQWRSTSSNSNDALAWACCLFISYTSFLKYTSLLLSTQAVLSGNQLFSLAVRESELTSVFFLNGVLLYFYAIWNKELYHTFSILPSLLDGYTDESKDFSIANAVCKYNSVWDFPNSLKEYLKDTDTIKVYFMLTYRLWMRDWGGSKHSFCLLLKSTEFFKSTSKIKAALHRFTGLLSHTL